MKLYIICFVIEIISPAMGKCQLFTSSASENYYEQKDVKESYSIYLTLTSVQNNDTDVLDKGRIERREFDKGLLKRKLVYNSPMEPAVYQYFYTDTNVFRLIIKRGGKIENYNYSYDTITNTLTKAVGYTGNKILYKQRTSKNVDTVVTTTLYRYPEISLTDTRKEWYSKDSIHKFTMNFADQWSTRFYTITTYNPMKQIVSELDSSKDNRLIKKYKYDSLGRTDNILWCDTVVRMSEKYQYEKEKTMASTFHYYQTSFERLEKQHTWQYDTSGQLIYEEIRNYSKPDVLPVPSKEAEEVVEKYYEHNKLQKVSIKYGTDTMYLYTFRYNKQ